MPRWAPLAIAAAGIAAGAGIGAGAGLTSHIQWGLIALVLFVVLSYAITATVEGRRQAKDRVVTSLVWACFVVAVIPLYSLVESTIAKGVKVLDGNFLSHSMDAGITTGPGGGIYHALVGTVLITVLLAAVISVPIGLLTAIYLVEYGRGRLAKADHLLRRRDDRHPVDRRRPVRYALLVALPGPGVHTGFAGGAGAALADDPGRGALLRGDAQAGPERAARGGATPSACRSGGRSSRSCCPPRSPASSPASRWRSPASSARPRRC